MFVSQREKEREWNKVTEHVVVYICMVSTYEKKNKIQMINKETKV